MATMADGLLDDSSSQSSSSVKTDEEQLTKAELLSLLKREIDKTVKVLEITGGCVETNGIKAFVWGATALRLFRTILKKTKLKAVSDPAAEKRNICSLLQYEVLPLWPHGWMTLGQLIQKIAGPKKKCENEPGPTTSKFAENEQPKPLVQVSNNALPETLKRSPSTSTPMTTRKETIIRCSNCPKAFNSIKGLSNHHFRQHVPKLIVCPTCGSKHTSEGALAQHEANVHRHKTPTQNLNTSVAAGGNATMNSSVSSDSLCATYSTTNTTYAIVPVVAARILMQSNLTADNSSQQTPTASTNGTAVTTVANTGESKDIFCCSVCGDKRLTERALKIHISKKHNSVNVVCPYCSRTFANAGSCYLHIEIDRCSLMAKPLIMPKPDSPKASLSLVDAECTTGVEQTETKADGQ